MTEAMYKDSFNKCFTDEMPFLQFLRERENNASWETNETKNIWFHGLEDGSSIAGMLQKEFDVTGKHDMMSDTFANTSLVAEIEGTYHPVRSTALKTILERANISGAALRKVKKPILARILNDCIQVANGKSLIRFSEDKISAVHSGDNSYSILEIPELFQITGDWLESNFPGYKFAGASYEHSIVTALWELTNSGDLVQTYVDFLDAHGMEHEEIKPALRLTTSDVGISGANLYPILFLGSESRIITLGSPLKLDHRNGANLEKFQEKLEGIYSQYSLAIGKLKELITVEVRNPVNCMAGVMKRIGIPKKLAMEAIEQFKAINGMDPCTAHDLYYGISQIIFMLQCEGAPGSKIAQAEENVARALSIRWHDYDIAGEMVW